MVLPRCGNFLFEAKKRVNDRMLPLVRVIAVVECINEQGKVERQLKGHRASFPQTGKLWKVYDAIQCVNMGSNLYP
jgi:hypothetical protein